MNRRSFIKRASAAVFGVLAAVYVPIVPSWAERPPEPEVLADEAFLDRIFGKYDRAFGALEDQIFCKTVIHHV
jgi:hypothetical protein